jgi:orotidine-5'-phosphate decarboxylase
MSNPICFAADFPTLGDAANFVAQHLRYSLGAVKVGLELFIAAGPRAVEVFVKELGIPVALDLKLHDIPETVARAVKAGGDLGVKFMTLHIQQRAALEQAVKAAEPFGMTLLGVTVLTSMTSDDFKDLDFHIPEETTPMGVVSSRVGTLAAFGHGCGLRGFVCSPKEVEMLRGMLPDAFLLVPGVRPLGSEVGDQRRTGTPGGAVLDGANLIVIGRPIRDAKDPVAAAQAILKEIEEAKRIEKVAQAGAREIAR